MKSIVTALMIVVLQLAGSVAFACQSQPRGELVDSIVVPECLIVNAGNSRVRFGGMCAPTALVIENRCSTEIVVNKLVVGINKESRKISPVVYANVYADGAMSKIKDINFDAKGKECDAEEILSLPKEELPKCNSVVLHQYNVINLPVTRGAYYLVQGHVRNVKPDDELYSVRAEGRLINPGDPDTALKEEELFPVMRYK